jgi:cellulose biosynthesis protein BcsQ
MVTDIYAGEEIYRSVIALLARDYDHVVIDLGVSMEGPLFGAAMKSADVVVVPVPCGDAALYARYEKIRATKLVIFVKGW